MDEKKIEIDDSTDDADTTDDKKEEDVDYDDGVHDDNTCPVPEEDLHSSEYYRRIKIVSPEDRITSDIMTLFEFSEVIGIRASQIEKGSQVFTDVRDISSARDMAIKELFDRRSPLVIIRQTGLFEQEHWKCNEMGFPSDVRSNF
jgi:DNA-directed RNA polymerase subunit K/omega